MSSNPIIKFAFSHRALVYNLGALSSYASQICFLIHAVHLLVTRSKPHASLVSFAVFSLTSILLMSPYKWDRKWMRYKSEVGMVTFSSVILIYIFCWILN